MRAGSRASSKAQHIDKNSAEGVAHVVFPGRSAPGRFRQILFLLFPDLSEKKEKYTYPLHIHMPDICIGKA
ncbi:hypothetical protein DYN38_22225 [Salmonella enterica subsp. enterica serovar Newport]|nr:hypothetical protein [Salmonella enterica]ECU3551595.1 hypothetical protein [Salmonella enterica subsp. enterica serovar Newport]EBG1349685.1 hypothetical protein [Salmonella enterica]EBK8335982.1 hypothetical protein [Salmonella enterica]EBP2086873.1 hypothetical protein [Salmonella enterica]